MTPTTPTPAELSARLKAENDSLVAAIREIAKRGHSVYLSAEPGNVRL